MNDTVEEKVDFGHNQEVEDIHGESKQQRYRYWHKTAAFDEQQQRKRNKIREIIKADARLLSETVIEEP